MKGTEEQPRPRRLRHRVLAASVLAGIAGGGLMAATQRLAGALPEAVRGEPDWAGLYAPYQALDWLGSLERYPMPFVEAATISVLGLLIGGPLGLAIASGLGRKAKAVKDLHGSARWATLDEIRKARLLNRAADGDSVYIGGFEYKGVLHYLQHSGPEHVMAIAPTRSGKGVGLVIPTLLSWTQSVVVLDIKGENYGLTSAWRSKYAGNRIVKFSPLTADSAGYNPLSEIRLGTDHEVSDVQNLVNIIVDPQGEGLKSHWDKTGHALVVGLILHVLYVAEQEPGKVASLAAVGELMTSTDLEAFYNDVQNYPHCEGLPHPVVFQSIQEMRNRDPKEASSVLSTAGSFFTLYRDPILARNTTHSDFSIDELMKGDRAVSLYVVIPPSDKARLRPVLRMLITQILTRRLAVLGDYDHRLLLMLDEFDSLGKLEIMAESLAYIAGYGIKAYLILQDLKQLRKAYGRDETISGNCHIHVAYATSRLNEDTAKALSDGCGVTTIDHVQHSESGKRFGLKLGQVNKSVQQTSRKLLTPDEVMSLEPATLDEQGRIIKGSRMLVLIAGIYPIMGRQILYFKDPILQARSALGALDGSNVLPEAEDPVAPQVDAPAPEPVTTGQVPPATARPAPSVAPAPTARPAGEPELDLLADDDDDDQEDSPCNAAPSDSAAPLAF